MDILWLTLTAASLANRSFLVAYIEVVVVHFHWTFLSFIIVQSKFELEGASEDTRS